MAIGIKILIILKKLTLPAAISFSASYTEYPHLKHPFGFLDSPALGAGKKSTLKKILNNSIILKIIFF